MSEDKSKLQLIGEIAQANNKNLELIEELNDRENEIERLNKSLEEQRHFYLEKLQQKENIIKEAIEYINNDKEYYEYDFDYILEILDKAGSEKE